MFSSKWDRRFLRLAKEVSTWSKDPSTKVGAVIVRPDKTIASVGFNGFPRYMNDDYTDRDTKLSRTIHAEINAILNAHEKVKGYVLYTSPFPPCDRCAVQIIQAGIMCVVTPRLPSWLPERWEESISKAVSYFREAGVEVKFFPEIEEKEIYHGPWKPVMAGHKGERVK